MRPASAGSILPAVFQFLSEVVVALTMSDVLGPEAALAADLDAAERAEREAERQARAEELERLVTPQK